MRRNPDIRDVLEAWPYVADDNVRLAKGADGRRIMQVRQPLGLEQYELQGRPDGLRPYDSESFLDYYTERIERSQGAGGEGKLVLGPEECSELFEEGTLFYCRYMYLFQLGDWKRVIRDTGRNLRLFDFVLRHAARAVDRAHLEPWRPYLLRMHAMARAMQAVEREKQAEALAIVREAVRRIEALPEMDDETFRLERRRSRSTLRKLAAELEEEAPVSLADKLERELREAVTAQEFERAARLRDTIRSLRAKAGDL